MKKSFRAIEEYFREANASQVIEPWSLWNAREHQAKVLPKLEEHKRNVLIWHRRAGKDLLAINYILHKSNQRKGLYWHIYPTYSQGKKALWDAMDSVGRKFIDVFSGEKNATEMAVKMNNGSKYQIIGSDADPASIRGSNPVGVVFSEYSYMKPDIWDVIRPILSENGGWVLFLYTPCGQNHGYDLFKMASENKNWYVEVLGVDKTGVIPEEEIQQLKDEGVSSELIGQEYYCEFLSHVYGSYFSSLINIREKAGFIKELNVESSLSVNTYWDIGHNTAIWFMQQQGEFPCLIDFIEGQGMPVEYYLSELKKRGYNYNEHVFPHDMANNEYASGHSRIDTAKRLATDMRLKGEIIIQKKMSLEGGLNITRQFIDKCKIDKVKCRLGLKALTEYKRAYSEKQKTFLDYPEKNQWAGHATDAFRYAAIGFLQNSLQLPHYSSIRVDRVYNYLEH